LNNCNNELKVNLSGISKKRCLLLRSICHYSEHQTIWRKCDSHTHWRRTGTKERVTSQSENKMIHITDQTNQLSITWS